MPAPAPWWNNPNSRDDKPVVAHTPDPSQYHYPDERQMERMRGGSTMGVVIPRANDDGTSKGFDGRVPGVVHVDPDSPDGGAVVDLMHLDRNAYNRAFAQATYPHEVFYSVGQHPSLYGVGKAAPPPPEVSRSNTLVPAGAYIVPAATDDGTQIQIQPAFQEEPMKSIPPLPGQQPVYPQHPAQAPAAPAVAPVASAPAPAPYPPQAPPPQYGPPQAFPGPVYGYPPPAAPPPQVPPLDLGPLYQMIGQLNAQVQQISQAQQAPMVPPVSEPSPPVPLRNMPQQRSQAPRARPPQPSEPSRLRPVPYRYPTEEEEGTGGDEYEPRQTVREVQEATRQEMSDGVVMGFETLNMRFLKGPLAEKPRKEVFFTMPGMGTMNVRYHDVREGNDCIALVYDTRYEDGQQWLPPNLGEQQIEVAVSKVKQGKRSLERHVCSSMGIHFQIGVLDIVVLIKHKDVEEVEYDEVEDDAD